jgi:hypothetical protein
MAAGMFLVASYFITALAQINSGLKPIARFSSLEYYQSGYAIRGLNLTWLGGLLGLAALFAVLAGWRFQRRDIRVAGEGSWRWQPRKPRPGTVSDTRATPEPHQSHRGQSGFLSRGREKGEKGDIQD